MDFKDLQKANESIATTDIKGKQYAEVNQRIKAFRMLYPEGFIRTNIESLENGICVIKAEVGFYEPINHKDFTGTRQIILGTGIAYEKEGSTFINKTSYIENCETSAVGRALGMMGIGIDVSVASAEEVQNAIAQQDQAKYEETKKKKITPTDVKVIQKKYATEAQQKNILNHFNLYSLEDMTVEQFAELVKAMNKEDSNDKGGTD